MPNTDDRLIQIIPEFLFLFLAFPCFPLAKVMRKELKSRGISGVKVVFSTEPFTKPFSDGENAGVIPSMIFVPAAAGLMLACEVVTYLCGKA